MTGWGVSNDPVVRAAPSPALVAAVRRILRPLVRVLIANGVTLPTLTALLKAIYVEEAERGFALPGKPTTDSRICLLTGLHRKDIARLRETGAADEAVAPSLPAQVLGRWIGHSGYRGDDGKPAVLTRGEFDALVQSVSKDVRPRALLDELQRSGLVGEAEDGRLTLVEAAHLPHGDYDKMAYWFGRNVADHLASAAHNLAGRQPPLLERALFHTGLTRDSVQALNAEATAAAMAVLVRLNERATEMGEQDKDQPDATCRFVAGVYIHAEDEAEAKP